MPAWACCQQSQVYLGNWVGWTWGEEPSPPGVGNGMLFANSTGNVARPEGCTLGDQAQGRCLHSAQHSDWEHARPRLDRPEALPVMVASI
jgi:hypothetical protein